MLKTGTDNKTKVDSNEIDLIALAKTLWNNRWRIIRIEIVFIAFGLFIALFSKKEYTASTSIVPQTSSPTAKMGGLSSLASLAGFNLDMNMGGIDISPILYPQIVQSISFQLEIMNSQYKFEEIDYQVSLFEYYMDYYKPGVIEWMKEYTIGLPGLILKTIRNKQASTLPVTDTLPIRISTDQETVRKLIEEQLTITVNENEGYITLNSRFHQSELSAQIAQKAQSLLQNYITRFKIEKAKSQYFFIHERYLETKQEFELAQTHLANFRDANKNISSALVQTELEQLRNEYTIAFEVYSELSKQLEQARIKMKEDTPVFAVIEEVSVPVEKSKPKRLMILVIWTVFGACIGVGWIFGRNFITSFKTRWKETSIRVD